MLAVIITINKDFIIKITASSSSTNGVAIYNIPSRCVIINRTYFVRSREREKRGEERRGEKRESNIMEENLPPGFRFHPTDEELITYYLSNKVSDFDFNTRAVADVDLNKCEPWDLPGIYIYINYP